jgi:phthiocerol/phenolphthiocerol synthesis type-I polyketide synthase C
MSIIAITGFSARLPGADDIDSVWGVLREGRCVVSQLPEDRWSSFRFLDPSAKLAGRSFTRAAGVLNRPWDFDATAFGISPREAIQMDPQQRLLLELTCEAFDHAGFDPRRANRDRIGVYIGGSAADHSITGLQDPRLIESHYMLGNTLSILANRISYQWDLHGPSMTVDTACSSGLVAFDLAHRAIEQGEIDVAVVGAINLLTSPVPFIGFSSAGMLSKRGRCAAFSAEGDGYVRAEGAVVFILTRAQFARDAGLRLRSVVAGTSVNTAGFTRGITIPSQERQAALIRNVIKDFGLDAEDLVFAEAHGTGTPVGDPREASALGETYGALRARPLPIGSAKSNFGHLEPASGLVGLLKAQLALENRYMPATLFADDPNPEIDFAALNLSLMTRPGPMPEHRNPRAVSVNSFGFGGANAHVVIREPDPQDRITTVQKPRVRPQPTPEPGMIGAQPGALPAALMLTAHSTTALRGLVTQWQSLVSRDQGGTGTARLATLIANANHNLAWRSHRLCLPAETRDMLSEQIEAWLQGDHPDRGGQYALGDGLPVAFVFSGNGALWDGMARHNYLKDPAFRKSFSDIAARVAAAGGADLISRLMTPQTEDEMRPAEVAQPLHFAIQLALVDSLAEAGLHPAAVMGHSLGEVAAAVCAGRISRDEGVHIILSRSAAFAPLKDSGTMAAMAGSRDSVAKLIAELGLPIDISAENTADSITVSGSKDDLAALIKAARRARIAAKLLPVAYPYHSRAVVPLEARMRSDLAGLRPGHDPDISFYSGCQGTNADELPLDADYWWKNARNSVEFRAATQAMLGDGYRLFVEISPRSVLRGYLSEIFTRTGDPALVIDSLERSHPQWRLSADISRRVLAAGGALDEEAILGIRMPMLSSPPRPDFERETYRLRAEHGLDMLARSTRHPLLGARSESEGRIWRNTLSLSLLPWLGDHRVAGRVLLPAAGIAEIFLAAARILAAEKSATGATPDAPPRALEITDLDISHALAIPEEGGIDIRVIHDAAARRLTLEAGGDDEWQIIAMARLFSAAENLDLLPDFARLAPAATDMTAATPNHALYAGLRRAGLDYGPAFARLAVVRPIAGGGEIRAAEADIRPAQTRDLELDLALDLTLDPSGFDAALHGLAALPGFADMQSQAGPLVPGRIGRLRWLCQGAPASARLILRSAAEESACLDLALFDADGRALAVAEEIRLRRMPQGQSGEQMFWREILLPLAGSQQPQGELIAAAEAAAEAADQQKGEAADADVLRSAIAARLAWDLSRDPARLGIEDPRLKICRDWLDEAGCPPPDADAAAQNCPWPEINELLPMLASVADDVQDDLQTALSLSAGRAPRGDGLDRSLAQIAAIAGALPEAAFGRVLVVGSRAADLLAPAARLGGGYVSLGAADAAAAAALRPALAGRENAAALVLLDEDCEGAGQSFDLILGVGLAQTAPAASGAGGGSGVGSGVGSGMRINPQALLGRLAPGGVVFLAAETPDLFAHLANRHHGAAILSDLQTSFADQGLSLRLAQAAGCEAVTLLAGRKSAACATIKAGGDALALMPGQASEAHSPLADALTKLAGAAVPAANGAWLRRLAPAPANESAVDRSLRHASVFRDLPEGKDPLWIIAGDCDEAGALFALRRVIVNESGRDLRVLALAANDSTTAGGNTAEQLAQRILALIRSGEHEIIADDAAGAPPASPRLIASPAPQPACPGGSDGEAPLLRLSARRRSPVLDGMYWRRLPRRAPGPDEVEILVEATGLNFRDVMWGQGLIPPEALEGGFAGQGFGMECAGRILRMGDRVPGDLSPGTPVIAFAPHAFSSHVTVPAHAVMRRPESLPAPIATAAPVVFLTADYALNELAHLAPQEWILIHGAAGGVGMAAVQIARQIGARIIATAGSVEKRLLLSTMGVDLVLDSRSGDFADQVLAASRGRGVDVVLNALAAEGLERGLACLAPFGRFVELGKRDIYENNLIAMRVLRNNISLLAVDADQLLTHRPQIAARVMARVATGLADGALVPPPVKVLPAEQIADGFRLMQRSGHIGKIVVTAPPAPGTPAPGTPKPPVPLPAAPISAATG